VVLRLGRASLWRDHDRRVLCATGPRRDSATEAADARAAFEAEEAIRSARRWWALLLGIAFALAYVTDGPKDVAFLAGYGPGLAVGSALLLLLQRWKPFFAPT
jgi:hypothetical protein